MQIYEKKTKLLYLCRKIFLFMHKKQTFGEILRFCIVGVVAVGIHYGVYWLLQHWLPVNVAFTIGYVVSFVANYLLSAAFTFREHTSTRNGVGFASAHAFNYCLQLGLFNFFLYLGISRVLAPFAVFSISVPINFLVVRYVFKHFSHS